MFLTVRAQWHYGLKEYNWVVTILSQLNIFSGGDNECNHRVTSCLKSLEMSDMSGISAKIRERSGIVRNKNFVRKNCPKTFLKIASSGFLVSLCSLSILCQLFCAVCC